MLGFELTTAALHLAGQSASDAGGRATSVDVGAALPAVTLAMPGGRSTTVALELAAAMRAALGTWASDATAFGADLRAAAEHYEANERFTELLFAQERLP